MALQPFWTYTFDIKALFFQLLLDASFDFLKLNRFSCFGVKLYMRIQILDSVILDGVTAFFGLKFNIISIKDWTQ